MFGFGSQELLIILALVIVLFGAKRIPQLGGSLGKGIRNFKSGLNSQDKEDSSEDPEQLDDNNQSQNQA